MSFDSRREIWTNQMDWNAKSKGQIEITIYVTAVTTKQFIILFFCFVRLLSLTLSRFLLSFFFCFGSFSLFCFSFFLLFCLMAASYHNVHCTSYCVSSPALLYLSFVCFFFIFSFFCTFLFQPSYCYLSWSCHFHRENCCLYIDMFDHISLPFRLNCPSSF